MSQTTLTKLPAPFNMGCSYFEASPCLFTDCYTESSFYSEQNSCVVNEASFRFPKQERVKVWILTQPSQKPLLTKSLEFVPKTKLAKKLWAIKQQMMIAGETLPVWDDVLSYIDEVRGL